MTLPVDGASEEPEQPATGDGRQGAASDMIRSLRNHPVLTAEEEARLTRAGRIGRTAEELSGQPADEDATGAAARQGVESDDAGWAATCREALDAHLAGRSWARLRAEGEQAREEMARCNQRLVLSCTAQFSGRGLDTEDLLQAGNLGLSRAIEKFDERKGNKFSTYAIWWIRQGMQHETATWGRAIRVPLHVQEIFFRVRAAQNRLTIELGREPTDQETAEAAETTPEQVDLMRTVWTDTISLENPDTDQEGRETSTSLRERYHQQTVPGPDAETMANALTADVRRALEKMEPRDRAILEKRFGLDQEVMSLRDIGNEMRLSPERVRQLESRGIRRLKQLIIYDGLDIYLSELA